jgi:hypothetical protein
MKASDYRRRNLEWDGLQLRLGSKRGRVLVSVERDAKRPRMYRVRLANGRLTDMANLTWAKDAAVSIALANLKLPIGPAEASPVSQTREAAE